jgi:monoamine oxidase
VLQANAGEAGAVPFDPPLPGQKHDALATLMMGKVMRVTLRFRDRFWENIHPAGCKDSLANLGFLLSEDERFPTWWTQMPQTAPIITGWAPAHYAEKLSGESEFFLMDESLASLSSIFGLEKAELEKQVEAFYCHDWQTDPFSRGAYSYSKVGGEGAQGVLAAPVDGTLFFAGEATDVTGHNGTVHGAIASGKRAAQEILRGTGVGLP